jgi:superfamily II DNA or RNA helicase
LFAGLNQEVHNFARELDYTIDDQTGFDVKREFSLTEAYDFYKSLGIPDKFTLREYQLRAFALAIRNRRATLISPTASGKSLIAYLITRYHNTKTLIVVPTTALVLQMIGDFKEYGYEGNIHGVMAGVEKTGVTFKITLETGNECTFKSNQRIKLLNNVIKEAKDLTTDDEIDDKWLEQYIKQQVS